jgi:hypothetical protein
MTTSIIGPRLQNMIERGTRTLYLALPVYWFLYVRVHSRQCCEELGTFRILYPNVPIELGNCAPLAVWND